jgi:FPC/CPF motif-containing protein YcgG
VYLVTELEIHTNVLLFRISLLSSCIEHCEQFNSIHFGFCIANTLLQTTEIYQVYEPTKAWVRSCAFQPRSLFVDLGQSQEVGRKMR